MDYIPEHVDVLNELGQPEGRVALREVVHTEGLWHKTVHLWVISPHKDIFLQKRSPTFYLGEGFLDATCVGHIQAGDNAEESVIRECYEELGIELQLDQIEYLGQDKFLSEGSTRFISRYINNEFHEVFVCKRDINLFDFKFDSGEMIGLELLTADQFRQMVENKDNSLVPQWNEYETLLWYLGGR